MLGYIKDNAYNLCNLVLRMWSINIGYYNYCYYYFFLKKKEPRLRYVRLLVQDYTASVAQARLAFDSGFNLLK